MLVPAEAAAIDEVTHLPEGFGPDLLSCCSRAVLQ
jgi:hypothetical protein